MSLNKRIVEGYRQNSVNKAKKSRIIGQDENVKNKESYPNIDQLIGVEKTVSELKRIIKQIEVNLDNPSRIFEQPFLIYGSKGLGKTTLMSAVAASSNLNFIRVDIRSIANKSKIEYETTLSMNIQKALDNQPSILFFDDIDSNQDFLPILTNLISKAMSEPRFIIIFCSACPGLDEQYFRSFGFAYTINLQRPDKLARAQMLRFFLSAQKYTISDCDIDLLASKTPSFKASDIKVLITNARWLSNIDRDNLTFSDFKVALEVVKKNLGKGTYLISEMPDVTWDDIGGLSHVRKEFQTILDCLRSTDSDEYLSHSNVILYGPPGCGKTTIAKAMANEAELNFISIKPTELLNKYLGETERNIRKVFEEAKEHEPCMIFFDEFEALCGTRGIKDNGAQAIQTLLSEIDGFDSRGKSFILAATNRLEDIDPAMTRPGRLSKLIYIGPPDKSARLEIIKVLSQNSSWTIDESLDFNTLANATEGLTGADMKSLISTAGLLAQEEKIDERKIPITMKHIELAKSKIKNVRRKV